MFGKENHVTDGRLCQRTKVVGVDPCEVNGQRDELGVFINAILPEATVIVNYSERAVRQVAAISKSYKIIHIDGGHFVSCSEQTSYYLQLFSTRRVFSL